MKLKHFMQENWKYLLWILAIVAAPAFGSDGAADNLDDLIRNNTKTQMSGLIFLMFMFAMVMGTVMAITFIVTGALLAFEKAPQQLEQAGVKVPIAAAIFAALALSFAWLLDFLTSTTTGDSGSRDSDTWEQLSPQGSSAPIQIEALDNNNVAQVYLLAYPEQEIG